MLMKQGIRVLGVDDSPFERGSRNALVLGAVCRSLGGPQREALIVEGVLSTRVAVDGDDGTDKLSAMITGSRFRPQLRAVMLNGIMLAGLNVVDITELSRRTDLPVLALTRKQPSRQPVERAIRKVAGWEGKLERMRSAGTASKAGRWNIQFAGTDLNKAREIVCIFGNGPSRLAHIMASGVVKGDSHGRA
jgi:uncharacterized protein